MEFNLAVDYQGYSSDVIVSSGSVDDAGSYVFEVPPEVAGTGVSKHICYWKAGDGVDTMISVWNHDSKAQDLVLTLHFDGGSYDYPIHLGAQSSATVNLFDILHSGVPDPGGHTIPAGIEIGSASLAGAAGEVALINVTLTAASYDTAHATCVFKCVSCNGYTSFSIFPQPWDTPYPSNLQLSGTGQFSTGNQYDLTAASTWSSSDTTIANVGNASSAGLISPVAFGDVTIHATTDDLPLAGRVCGDPPDCTELNGPLPASAGGNVGQRFVASFIELLSD